MDIDCLTQRDKAIFAIRLAEKANFYLQVDSQNIVKEALFHCWEWIETESDLGEELYFFLDNEENGFTSLQEFEEDAIKISAWNCIIDAIAIVSRMAYEKMGQRFFPEAIEIVDDRTFSHMISALLFCNDTEKDYIASVYDACLKEQQDTTPIH